MVSIIFRITNWRKSIICITLKSLAKVFRGYQYFHSSTMKPIKKTYWFVMKKRLDTISRKFSFLKRFIVYILRLYNVNVQLSSLATLSAKKMLWLYFIGFLLSGKISSLRDIFVTFPDQNFKFVTYPERSSKINHASTAL